MTLLLHSFNEKDTSEWINNKKENRHIKVN